MDKEIVIKERWNELKDNWSNEKFKDILTRLINESKTYLELSEAESSRIDELLSESEINGYKDYRKIDLPLKVKRYLDRRFGDFVIELPYKMIGTLVDTLEDKYGSNKIAMNSSKRVFNYAEIEKQFKSNVSTDAKKVSDLHNILNLDKFWRRDYTLNLKNLQKRLRMEHGNLAVFFQEAMNEFTESIYTEN